MNAQDLKSRYLEILKASPYIQSVAKPGRTIVDIETYNYNVTVGTAALQLLVNVPRTVNLQMQSDSDFVLSYLSASVNITLNGDMKYNRNITLQIQDQSTGKYFFNTPTVMGLVSGGGGFPYVFPAPRVINPNTNLAITMMNRDTFTNYYNGYVSFYGARIYYAG